MYIPWLFPYYEHFMFLRSCHEGSLLVMSWWLSILQCYIPWWLMVMWFPMPPRGMVVCSGHGMFLLEPILQGSHWPQVAKHKFRKYRWSKRQSTTSALAQVQKLHLTLLLGHMAVPSCSCSWTSTGGSVSHENFEAAPGRPGSCAEVRHCFWRRA